MPGDDAWDLPPEGDLDPDLAEGADYADWGAERGRGGRRGWVAVVSALLIAALVVPVVIRVLTA